MDGPTSGEFGPLRLHNHRDTLGFHGTSILSLWMIVVGAGLDRHGWGRFAGWVFRLGVLGCVMWRRGSGLCVVLGECACEELCLCARAR